MKPILKTTAPALAGALLLALVTVAPLGAQMRRGGGGQMGQMGQMGRGQMAMEGGGQFPAGWSVRPDSGNADQLAFHDVNGVYQFRTQPAGTFYNPAWTKSGDYSFSARLKQNMAPSHPISYGLMIGGSDLAGADETYTYFLVRNQGDYYIANREGSEVNAVVAWTMNDAIHKQADDGTQVNTLAIQTQGNDVIFSVNGTEVKRLPKSGLHTDGLYGFRIGHSQSVDVDQVMR